QPRLERRREFFVNPGPERTATGTAEVLNLPHRVRTPPPSTQALTLVQLNQIKSNKSIMSSDTASTVVAPNQRSPSSPGNEEGHAKEHAQEHLNPKSSPTSKYASTPPLLGDPPILGKLTGAGGGGGGGAGAGPPAPRLPRWLPQASDKGKGKEILTTPTRPIPTRRASAPASTAAPVAGPSKQRMPSAVAPVPKVPQNARMLHWIRDQMGRAARSSYTERVAAQVENGPVIR
ncbi:hypothetical protein F5Y14DRAFT_208328, partial [Nemania sp. NC0429]